MSQSRRLLHWPLSWRNSPEASRRRLRRSSCPSSYRTTPTEPLPLLRAPARSASTAYILRLSSVGTTDHRHLLVHKGTQRRSALDPAEGQEVVRAKVPLVSLALQSVRGETRGQHRVACPEPAERSEEQPTEQQRHADLGHAERRP